MRARHSIGAQAAEARRQLAMMRGVYPRMADAGVVTREEIDCDIGIMESVVGTLEWLEKHKERIRAKLATEQPVWSE